jgi:hypothetical protein
MGPGLLLLLLSTVHLSVQHWCDDNTCDLATDEQYNEYTVEDPTEEERSMCAEQTMVYVKDGERYCFLKDQTPGKPAIEVSLECSDKAETGTEGHPYECPNKKQKNAWGYKEGFDKIRKEQILTPNLWTNVWNVSEECDGEKEGCEGCGGKYQSPVNLPAKDAVEIKNNKKEHPLIMENYDNIELKDMRVENNGHSIELEVLEEKHSKVSQ